MLNYSKECVLCGKKLDWYHPTKNPYGLQVSHFVPRTCLSLRWDFDNALPMCAFCNQRHSTDPKPYRKLMNLIVGEKRVEELIFRKKNPVKISIPQLLEKRKALALICIDNIYNMCYNGQRKEGVMEIQELIKKLKEMEISTREASISWEDLTEEAKSKMAEHFFNGDYEKANAVCGRGWGVFYYRDSDYGEG